MTSSSSVPLRCLCFSSNPGVASSRTQMKAISLKHNHQEGQSHLPDSGRAESQPPRLPASSPQPRHIDLTQTLGSVYLWYHTAAIFTVQGTQPQDRGWSLALGTELTKGSKDQGLRAPGEHILPPAFSGVTLRHRVQMLPRLPWGNQVLFSCPCDNLHIS